MEKKKLEEFDVQQWLTSRREAGLKIDPETAEVRWEYGQVMDPYGVNKVCPRNVGKLDGNTSPDLLEVTYG
jgi:hypothetical protein